jgi:hypothetical protein
MSQSPRPLKLAPSPDQRPLSPAEERARAAAVQGYVRARDGNHEQAIEHFAEAARLDAELDLTTIPGFWTLPRGAHDAAATAYERAGRERDAWRLRAVIRRTYRPRLVPAGSATITPLHPDTGTENAAPGS